MTLTYENPVRNPVRTNEASSKVQSLRTCIPYIWTGGQLVYETYGASEGKTLYETTRAREDLSYSTEPLPFWPRRGEVKRRRARTVLQRRNCKSIFRHRISLSANRTVGSPSCRFSWSPIRGNSHTIVGILSPCS